MASSPVKRWFQYREPDGAYTENRVTLVCTLCQIQNKYQTASLRRLIEHHRNVHVAGFVTKTMLIVQTQMWELERWEKSRQQTAELTQWVGHRGYEYYRSGHSLPSYLRGLDGLTS